MAEERKEKVESEITRGFQARGIINDSIFQDSMKRLKDEIVEKWAACPARDTAGREWLWQHYQVALKFEELLTTVLNTGKLALKEREMSLTEKIGQKIRSIV